MLNDLHSKGLLHKYMDDSTITEEVIDPADSIMQDVVNDIVKWSDDNNTRINGNKTKEMIISFKKKPPHFPLLKVRGITIERVVSLKLLGIYVYSDPLNGVLISATSTQKQTNDCTFLSV